MNQKPKKISIGLVGFGYWGPNIARNLYALKNIELRYICDIDANRLNSAKIQYSSVITTDSIKTLLDDISLDALAIAVPDALHYPLAKQALLAGKHCFVEKPFVLKSADASELFRIAGKKNKILFVGHTYLFSPEIRGIKKIIDANELGKPLYAVSQRCNLGLWRSDVSALWDLLPHDISIFAYIFNDFPRRVFCSGKDYLKKNVCDEISAILEFKNNIAVNIICSRLYPQKIREINIIGSDKMLRFDDMSSADKITVFDKKIAVHSSGKSKSTAQYIDRGCRPLKISKEESLKNECLEFANLICGKEKPDYAKPAFNINIIKILEALQRSLEISMFVKVGNCSVI